MSRESREWLSQNVLVGWTDKRGTAWHYKNGDDNHYPGAIPASEVERRLFNWEPAVNLHKCPCGCDDVMKTISRSDNRHRMGVFKEGYEPHGYREWLLNMTSNLLGDSMGIGSAGLLRKGAVAWVSVEVPDTVMTKEGVAFRPHLLATTSCDGSSATTYKRVVTFTVCDNTRDAALSESGQQYKIKHSRYSGFRLNDARDALNMVHEIADEVQNEITELVAITVTDAQWFKFLDAYVPIPTDKGRSQSMAQTKQDKLTAMYRSDPRWSAWKGTALGVVQAVDTYIQHEQTVRGAMRPERNMLNTISGTTTAEDLKALDLLKLVLV